MKSENKVKFQTCLGVSLLSHLAQIQARLRRLSLVLGKSPKNPYGVSPWQVLDRDVQHEKKCPQGRFFCYKLEIESTVFVMLLFADLQELKFFQYRLIIFFATHHHVHDRRYTPEE